MLMLLFTFKHYNIQCINTYLAYKTIRLSIDYLVLVYCGVLMDFYNAIPVGKPQEINANQT